MAKMPLQSDHYGIVPLPLSLMNCKASLTLSFWCLWTLVARSLYVSHDYYVYEQTISIANAYEADQSPYYIFNFKIGQEDVLERYYTVPLRPQTLRTIPFSAKHLVVNTTDIDITFGKSDKTPEAIFHIQANCDGQEHWTPLGDNALIYCVYKCKVARKQPPENQWEISESLEGNSLAE